MSSPICLALDGRDRGAITSVATATSKYIGVLKVGSTTFISFGRELVDELGSIKPVFLDLKLHDIPAQVAGATAAIADLGVSYTTVHAAGGADMVRAAVDAAGDSVTVLAVTALTSLDDAALQRLGFDGSAHDAVLRLADLAVEAGATGLVCSPLEVAALRARFSGALLVVPGIRLASGDDDQKRTLGPEAAISAGADLIVVGRPIAAAADPVAAAKEMLAKLEGSL